MRRGGENSPYLSEKHQVILSENRVETRFAFDTCSNNSTDVRVRITSSRGAGNLWPRQTRAAEVKGERKGYVARKSLNREKPAAEVRRHARVASSTAAQADGILGKIDG